VSPDHFNWGSPAFNPPQYTFKQRYFSYDKYHKPGGPIFFYFGNEGERQPHPPRAPPLLR
jgi:hypothetical protein